jgi:hypothetical protein
MTYMTYALWGRGDLAPENAVKLLEEYIPDNVGTVYRPEVVDREHQGLRNALDWFEAPEFLGEGGAVPTTDIVQSLLADRENNGDEVYLLALWPAEATHEEFDFIELVQNSGITVFDLSRALDELDLSLYSRPEPTKEEKAEAKAAASEVKRGRGRPRKKLSDDAEAQEAEAGKVSETPEPAEVAPEPDVDAGILKSPVYAEVDHEDLKAVVMNEMLKDTTADLLLKALDTYIEAKVAEILARRAVESSAKAEDAAKTEEERPPFDGPYVDVDTKPYFYSKSANTWRPAVGKPRRGEVVHNLTEEEAKEKGAL